MSGRPILFGAPVEMPKRNAAIEATRQMSRELFPSEDTARRFLLQVILPPSMQWGFISTGKNASSSVLRFLFEAEFACELTVSVSPLHDINPSAEVHMLAEHGVFSRALWRGLSMPDLLTEAGPKERIAVVRNPLDRAVSAFRYLCQSHQLKSRWFARDRFRMNAVTAFDWERHVNTQDGFIRFLDYIAWQVETEGADSVNAHWCPQSTFIKPQVFDPTIVGRMEEMHIFFETLSQRFELPSPYTTPFDNSQLTSEDPLKEDWQAKGLCAQIYAKDYDNFHY